MRKLRKSVTVSLSFCCLEQFSLFYSPKYYFILNLLYQLCIPSYLLATFQPVMFENIVMENLHMLRELAMNADTEKRKVDSTGQIKYP